MIATDRDALVCDLAETYHLFDMKALPVSTVATLSFGLRDDSRIKMAMTGQKVPTNTLILASIADRTGLLVWAETKDGAKGRNRPKSIVEALQGTETDEKVMAFETPEDFAASWAQITGGE